ncbi:MAG: oxidoreductase [Rhodospirillales bacterium]|nr:oxidoreductase [Rhodospirillales bacterium]
MFVDARRIASGTMIEADLCIVGSGAAGITIARRFAAGGIRTCLLESGDLDFDWDVQDLAKGENSGHPYYPLDACQMRFFGGNTNAWAGWCRPFDPIDFQERPWVPDSGWPFERQELDRWYSEAHEVCQLKTREYDPAGSVERLSDRRANLLGFDPAKVEPTIYHFSPPTRFGRVYRNEIDRSDSVRCLLNAHVLGVRAAVDCRSVEHVDVGTLAGNRFRVAAKVFVLAAGGIENARLLLLSNDVAPAGLGNDHDLVGRYFMEHPHTKRTVIALDRRVPIGLYGLTFYHRGLAARLALPPELQRTEQILNYSANLHQVYYGHETPGWIAFRKFIFSLMPSRDTDPYVRFPPLDLKRLTARDVWHIASQLDRVTVAAFLQWRQPLRLVRKFLLESKSEQAPNRDSRVTLLHHERDAFGLPRARLAWRTLGIDRRTAVRGEEIVNEELHRLRIGRLEDLPESDVEGWPRNLEGGWHQIGTTRMHQDPRRGVIDADCRVHGMENLFIGGSSVFPTAGAAPPTLTIVAMALRLAAHLNGVLVAQRPAVSVRVRPAETQQVAAPVLSRAVTGAPPRAAPGVGGT